MPLCRLRYLGNPHEWGFAIYLASKDGYEDSGLPTGSFTGTPEQALDCLRPLPLRHRVDRNRYTRERAIHRLRTSKPDYEFSIGSEIDHHHNRLRYRWNMSRKGRTLMEGLDITTLAPSGLIERVDGFFGHPTPVKDDDSGVPVSLQGGSVPAGSA